MIYVIAMVLKAKGILKEEHSLNLRLFALERDPCSNGC